MIRRNGHTMKKLYFIIPVYKVEEYLRRCVDSVLGQSYENIEIVLVDDGSPDGCPAICDGYAEKSEKIRVIHKRNGGLSDARNAGLRLVMEEAEDTDFIAFVDSDDYVHPDFARRLMSLCEERACGVAQCGYEKGSGGGFSPAAPEPAVTVTDAETALLGYELRSQAHSKIYRVGTFRDLYYPLGMLNEDEFVTYRAVYRAGRVAITTEKLYYYFQRGSSIMDDIARRMKNNPHRYDYLRAYEGRAAFFEKEGRPLQVMRAREKICRDIILRYCEQMYLPRQDRDEACVSGEYMRIYRENFPKMILRRGMPLKQRLMYTAFYVVPYSAVIAGRMFTLRK